MRKFNINILLYFLAAIIVILGISNENKKTATAIKNNPTANLLLLGTDGSQKNTIERADAIILISLNQMTKVITLISIPRDSLVNIPCGPNGTIYDKINHAYSYGDKYWKNKGKGVVCMNQTIENLFGLVDLSYIQIGFSGLKDIVNKIGGIEVKPVTSFCQSGYDNQNYCFEKNKSINMKDEQFVSYIRHRSTLLRGDLDRTANQRTALISLFSKTKKISSLKRVELTVYGMSKTKNNLQISKIYQYTKLNLDEYTFNSIMVQGSDVKGEVYYYNLNQKHLQTIKNMVNGKS